MKGNKGGSVAMGNLTGLTRNTTIERNTFMLCPTGLALSEELKAAGLEVSIAESDRDELGVIAARGRKRDAQKALNEHRQDCNICDNPRV